VLRRDSTISIIGVLLLVAGIPLTVMLARSAGSTHGTPPSGDEKIETVQCRSAAECKGLGQTQVGVSSLPLPGSPFRFVSGQVLSSPERGTTLAISYRLGDQPLTVTVGKHPPRKCVEQPPREQTVTTPAGTTYCRFESEVIQAGQLQVNDLGFTFQAPAGEPVIAQAIDALSQR
jgi:hypothetical protein